MQPSAQREGFATVPAVSWDDVGSLECVREELAFAITLPIAHPQRWRAYAQRSADAAAHAASLADARAAAASAEAQLEAHRRLAGAGLVGRVGASTPLFSRVDALISGAADAARGLRADAESAASAAAAAAAESAERDAQAGGVFAAHRDALAWEGAA